MSSNVQNAIWDPALRSGAGGWRAMKTTDLGGGGGGGGDASAANQVLLQAAIGSPTDAAWDGVAASATVISLLKAVALNTASVVVP